MAYHICSGRHVLNNNTDSSSTVKRNQSVNRVPDIIEAMAKHREPVRQHEPAKKPGRAFLALYLKILPFGLVHPDKIHGRP